jgi:hypothetical protein
MQKKLEENNEDLNESDLKELEDLETLDSKSGESYDSKNQSHRVKSEDYSVNGLGSDYSFYFFK